MQQELKNDILKDINMCRNYDEVEGAALLDSELKKKYEKLFPGFIEKCPIATHYLSRTKPVDHRGDLRNIANELEKILFTDYSGESKVFIVHGHNHQVRDDIAEFVSEIGCLPIILSQQANSGMTIIEKLECYTDVSYGIVIYTPCDIGKSTEEPECHNRARQNVVFEHGMLMQKLGRKNLAIIKYGDVEMPGDVEGMVYIEYGVEKPWKTDLIGDMRKAGINLSLQDRKCEIRGLL